MNIDGKEVEILIEIRGVYDGWSVARTVDGEYINRWPKNDRRHQPTADWIARTLLGEEE